MYSKILGFWLSSFFDNFSNASESKVQIYNDIILPESRTIATDKIWFKQLNPGFN